MACLGGCSSGGGQPRYDQTYQKDIKTKRLEALYNNDKKLKVRNSFENKDIINLYQEFLESPLSMVSEKLLHTKYKNVNNKDKIVN
jgi:iron only hydrogenase large subunit-like protein